MIMLAAFTSRAAVTNSRTLKFALRQPLRPTAYRHHSSRGVYLITSALVLTAALSLGLPRNTLHADAPSISNEDQVDSATGITFPNALTIPSKFPLPKFTLLGLGVRTVSFLGIKVYSVGFYADLTNPNLDLAAFPTTEEKIKHIVKTTACVLRIVPTRSTSYSHLRDGFVRAITTRITSVKIDEKDERAVQGSVRQLKSMFPTTPLAKHTPLELVLTPPRPGRERALVIRDVGAVENTWVAEELVMSYFDGKVISPPLKQSVAGFVEAMKT